MTGSDLLRAAPFMPTRCAELAATSTAPIDTAPASYHIGAMIDWSKCPDAESVPGRCSGAWVVRGTRVIVESCILGNAEDCSAEEVADMFALPVDIVKRILAFAAKA